MITTTFGFDNDLLDKTSEFYIQAAAAIISTFESRVRRAVRAFGFRITNVRVLFSESGSRTNLPANAKILYDFTKEVDASETVDESKVKIYINNELSEASHNSIEADDGTFILRETEVAIDSAIELKATYKGS